MGWRNTSDSFGLVTRLLHWLMAYKLWPAWGLTMGAGLVILLALRVRWGRVARWGARKTA